MARRPRIVFVLFWVVFALFCTDVAVGRLGVAMGSGSGSWLGDVGQFLLLAVAAVLLTVEALRRERLRQEDQPRAKKAAPVSPHRLTARATTRQGGNDHVRHGHAADRPRTRRTRPHDGAPARPR